MSGSILLPNGSPIHQHIQIGSFSARAFFESRADAALLNEMFKATVREPTSADAPLDAELYWLHSSNGNASSPIPPDSLRVAHINEQVWSVESQVLHARLELEAPLPKILLSSDPHNLSEFEWRVHVSIVFHKLLLLLARMYLHAGAVQIGGAASAFIGEKGSGKSTICLWLGRAGATILSDDHISIRRRDEAFYASGCEQVARVTGDTEAALLPQTLTVEARDFGGVLKKEFAVRDWFAALPYRDVRLEKIFFPHVGARWQLRPLSPRHVTTRLLQTTRSSHRFADKDDYARHLRYFSELAQAVEGFALELSPNITELDRLVTFLGA
ncbi:MAG TPA: hypothetical protein VFD70_13890 [Anaerolineae bacterium]|nr:hypothetical protein [Anaerolineae bacterium]